jgi:FkbM family methyltransferase
MSTGKSVISQEFIRNFLSENRVVVVDGGSRGALFAPFDQVSGNLLQVLRFEPDPQAEINKSDDEVIFNKGLWKEEAMVNLNLAKNPSTSSVYPPNKALLERFDDRVGYPPRKTEKVLEIEGVDIDRAVKIANVPLVDFIKLDIHGAEYEAVLGATESLTHSCVGLLVEAWFIDVHSGQKLIFDVEKLLAEKGFYKFGNTQVISWPRKQVKKLKSKGQIVGEENYYMFVCNSKQDIERLGKVRAIKLAAIADLFGHTDYALQLFNMIHEAGFLSATEYEKIKAHIVAQNKIRLMDRFIAKGIHMLQRMRDKRM